MPANLVYFAHGQESGPWGSKIRRLAQIAEQKGFRVESPDYTGLDDPDIRVEKLLSLQPYAEGKLVLVGSSMGGYVAAAASEKLRPHGLFLLAPAVLMPGFGRQDIRPQARVAVAVQGWQDEVIPVEQVIRFCQQHRISLHLLNAEHRLMEVLDELDLLFAHFLYRVLLA